MGPPRRPSSQQDLLELVFAHPQVTGDTTTKEFKTGSRKFRIDSVDYLNPTGLAESATDYFNVKLKNGTTVLANRSSATVAAGGHGNMTADTFLAATLNATTSNLVLDPGTTLSLELDETGTATLPAGKLIVRGRYL